ncbi:hypothetical protein HN51_039734 [Arachis hypogaea]|uniref:C2 domain-containing protein n=2 Tax=Arachis hypogaea TaxID=3818 RepID=A0A444YKN2_ARAHY|nr:uncharacterized protein LOC107646443 [Arachis ipaensis]XP_025663659.1 uncharacterized protein LOC112759052 [Arachis hypogaea]QHN85322.1 hypothetical protein DS421_16g536380 [Arachis hypogaea]RYR02471.1 hypothetical protein Ahy_B06g081256 isoform C [Arachis hypogaea]
MSVAAPFQLLEINIISAQDLAPISKSMRAYAVAWLNPERKLATRVDEVGHTNPTWNEKFVYRVDEDFLSNENSVIMIEIYTNAWLRDVLVGTVGVLVSNLIPPSSRSGNRKPNLRFVALQIRRPSGRPQGILNIGVTLLDSTKRSMPMYSELSNSAVGYWDLKDPKKMTRHQNDDAESQDNGINDQKLLTLQRCQSEKNDSTINDYTYQGAGQNFYAHDGHDESEFLTLRKGTPIVNLNGSLCSDVGPSPSVVAAAIAKGLYPMPALPPRSAESSAIDGWTGNSNSEVGMRTKIERWRIELTPAYDLDHQQSAPPSEVSEEFEVKKYKSSKRGVGKTPGRRSSIGGNRQQQQQQKGLFSCFGTVFGCEISITCGGKRKKRHQGGKSHVISGSELTYDESSQCRD